MKIPKPKHVECQYCGKKFHPKGVRVHERKCSSRHENTVFASQLTPKLIATADDLQRALERGRKEGEEQYKTRFSDTQLRALEAAVKVVDAIAHMIGDIR